MKRTRVSSIALRWILAVSLTASPLLAEYPPQPREAQARQREASNREAQARQREASNDVAVTAHRPAVRVVDENDDPLVGTTIFSTISEPSPYRACASRSEPSPYRARASRLTNSPAASAGQDDTQRNGVELGAPKPAGGSDQGKAEPGGKTMQELIIAALIAGGVVALILLLGGSDHKKPAAAVTTPPTPHTTTPPPSGTGTVLVPGTPSVSSPH